MQMLYKEMRSWATNQIARKALSTSTVYANIRYFFEPL
jgi:hypothetical protein